MILYTTELGHQAMLSDHAWLGQDSQVPRAALLNSQMTVMTDVKRQSWVFQAMLDDQNEIYVNKKYGWTLHSCSSACSFNYKHGFH